MCLVSRAESCDPRPNAAPVRTRLLRVAIFGIASRLFAPAPSGAQPRTMAQDPGLDNLRHAPGTVTVPPNTLGRIQRVGDGPRVMILIPGLGFGDAMWTEFMDRHKGEATMYALTLPGFGGTPPLPMPPDATPFSSTPWTRSAVRAIEDLWAREHLTHVTLVAHWALSTQIALELALDHPERVDALVIVGGPLQVYYEGRTDMRAWTPAERSRFVEGMASHWFRTVTRRTWDDNNFMSYDYAINPRRALFLWREAQEPSLPVWVRYLLEFYSGDLATRLEDLRVPTLVVEPAFDDPASYVEPDRPYMRNLCHDSWQVAGLPSGRIEFARVSGARLFVMFDQPTELDRLLREFLAKVDRHR